MTKRNLLLVALVVVAVAAVSHYSSKRSNEKADRRIGQPILDSALFESTDTILFAKEEQEVALKKKGERWLVKNREDYPADMEKLLAIFEKVSSYRIHSMVVKEATLERLGDFETLYQGEGSATETAVGSQLTLKRGEEILFRFVAGKNRQATGQNSGFGGTYIRMGEQKSVYLIKEDLVFDVSPENWLQTKLFHIGRDQIKSIGFRVKEESFEFAREEKTKPFSLKETKEGESLQSNPLSGVINDLEEFSVKDVEKLADGSDGERQTASEVSILLFDGGKIELEFLYRSEKSGEEEEKDYFVKILPATKAYDKSIAELGEKWLFSVENWKAEKWIKARGEYLKEK